MLGAIGRGARLSFLPHRRVGGGGGDRAHLLLGLRDNSNGVAGLAGATGAGEVRQFFF